MSEVLTLNSELLEIFRVYFVCVAEKEFDFREKGLLAKHRKKLRKCVRLMSLSFVFHSIYLEAAEKYEKSLETLKYFTKIYRKTNKFSLKFVRKVRFLAVFGVS